MIKRQWYWNLREIRVFFYEWVERCETGKAWDLLCKKKKMFFESTLCCLTPLFFFFFWLVGWFFKFFISSYQVKLGCLDLVWVDCRKFCALFFCLFVAFLFLNFFPCCFFLFVFFLCAHLFCPKLLGFFFFFPKISHFGICLLGFLRIFFPRILLLFFLSFFVYFLK